MPDVVGIRFKCCGKIYDFEINGLETKEGEHVIVESDFGLSLGKVIRGRRTIEKTERELKRVVRNATEEDFQTRDENKLLEKEALDFCVERIMARGLPMKLVSTETTLDKKRIVFYFTAEGRIDFRELVKDLASRFKTRIEMRQIGVRDEAKLVGGFGVCGRPLCCNTFLTSFEPVSIKMAKKQEMVLNIGKLSGLCSRLMCCLRYEYDGDLATISTDDEIPPETALLPAEKSTEKNLLVVLAEEKIGIDPEITTTQVLPVALAPQSTAAVSAPVPQQQQEKPAGEQAESKDDAQRKKNRKRFRRRRFKKNELPKKEP
jgi:cell fate regulator YaaT (PSP1 superfamily)